MRAAARAPHGAAAAVGQPGVDQTYCEGIDDNHAGLLANIVVRALFGASSYLENGFR